MPLLRPIVLAGLFLLATAAPAGAAPDRRDAGPPESRCAEPSGAAEQRSLDPAAAGFDARALDRAIRGATTQAGGSVAVYRYGCRVGTADSEGPDRGYQSWSMSKSVVSMAVSRAMRLGLLSMDDTVGSLIPEASTEHGAITVRNLLQQNSGLHQQLIRDYNFILDDHLQNALTLPFDHPRGTHFTYGQVTVSLLAEVVGRAAGEDYQAFLRRELFAPLGIPGDAAAIHRDRAGRTDGYMGIEMAPRYWGRLGRLLLQDGRWGGRQLLDEDWMAQVGRGTATNACYSLLFWPDAPGCAPRWAPADGYEMNGLGEQIVWVVPSQSLVVVRLGTITSGVKDALKEGVVAAVRRPAPVPARAPEDATGEPSVDPDAVFRTILDLRDILAVAGVRLEPLPAPGPTRARVPQLPSRALTAAGGTLEVPVACPRMARVPCAGELDVLPAAATKAAATDPLPAVPAAAGMPKSAALAAGSYRVAPGTRGTVRLASTDLRRAIGAPGADLVVRTRSTDAGGGVVGTTAVRVTAPAVRRSRLTLKTVRLDARRVRVRTSAATTIRVRVQRRTAGRWTTVRRATVRARRAGTVTARLRRLPAARYRVLLDARAADGRTARARKTGTVR